MNAQTVSINRVLLRGLPASLALAAFLFGPAPALAVATAPNLGAALQNFTVLGRNSTPTSGTVTCTTSTITGTVGSTGNSITNTGCTIASVVAPVSATVTNAFDNAYSAINSQNAVCDTIQAGTLAGVSLAPGVHCFTAAAALTGVLTLTGGPNGIYVFRIGTGVAGGALTATNFTVNTPGGAQACNVFWESAGATTLTTSNFIGTILSGNSITISGGTFTGRALATTDATITTVGGTVGQGACIAAPTTTMTVTKISNGTVGPFSFTGTNGFAPQTITTVTSGTGVSGATQTLTTQGAVTTITEAAPPAGVVLTSIACSGFGPGGTATPNLVTRTVTLDAAATATGAIVCTFTNTLAALAQPTLTITKISNGFAGSFDFTGTNGIAPQTITTVASGIGVSGPSQTLTATGVSTTVTESPPPANFTLSSITCSGLGAGGTATPNIATRTIALDAAATAAGSTIACTFTNTFAAVAAAPIPTLSEWAMILLAGLLAIAGFVTLRRKDRAS